MNEIRIAFLAIAMVLASIACQPVQQANMSTPAPQPSAAPTSTPASAADTKGAAFTMPILAAMLSDEEFLKEAKSSLNITEDELKKLRDAVTEAMSDLDETEAEVRSAKASSDSARAKATEVLGRERGEKLIALVQQRYAGKDTLATTEPNSLPSDTRIVVNIPAYRMDIFKDGKLTKTYKVGIGYPEFPLPTGLRQATEIIFNPTWTPPDEPWVKGKVKPFEKVEAGSKLNPLGRIKVPIGLPNLIHGGKSPAKLGTFASHGCVGLTDGQVKDFAAELSALAGKPISPEEIKTYLADKTETKSVKLPHPIPVELRYETIVVENGVLKIFRDVYEQGTNTEENLQRVLAVYGMSLDQFDAAARQQALDALNEMQLDASGKLPEGASSNSNKPARNSRNLNATRVTRAVKGRKEVDLRIPALAGKGYPSPVNLKAA
jgi:lipoprotein-anchoring transpeptidase ErfK/SrfK